MGMMRQIKRLDQQYAAGAIPEKQYRQQRTELDVRLAAFSEAVTQQMQGAAYSSDGGQYVYNNSPANHSGGSHASTPQQTYVQGPAFRPGGGAYKPSSYPTYVQTPSRAPDQTASATPNYPIYVPTQQAQPNAANYQAPIYVQNPPRQSQLSSTNYQAPVYVQNPTQQPKSGSSTYQPPAYVPNKKNGSSLPPGRISSANWEYAKSEIAKHEELKHQLGPVGWLWTGAEYIAINSYIDEVGGELLGLKPTTYTGQFIAKKLGGATINKAEEEIRKVNQSK